MRNQSNIVSLPFFDELRLRLRNTGISIQEILAFIRIKNPSFITEKNIKNITNQLEVLRISLIKELGEIEEDSVTDIDSVENSTNKDEKFVPKLDEIKATEELYFFQKTRVDEMRKIEKDQQFPMKMVQWGVDSMLKILNSSFEMKLEAGMVKKEGEEDSDYTKVNISIEAKKYGDRVVAMFNKPETRNKLLGIAQKLAIAASNESMVERTRVDEKTEVLVDKKKGSKK